MDVGLGQQLIFQKPDQWHADDQQKERVKIDIIDGCTFDNPALVNRCTGAQTLLEIAEHMAAAVKCICSAAAAKVPSWDTVIKIWQSVRVINDFS